MSDFSLIAYSGTIGEPENLKVRKLKEGISTEDIKKATQNNEIDEVIVKDAKGDKYIIYADELTSDDGNLAKVAKANPNIDFWNDEPNEDVGAEFSAAGEGTIAGAAHEREQNLKIENISEYVSDTVKNNILKNIK